MAEGSGEAFPAMPDKPLRDGVDALFHADDVVLDAVTTNLASRTAVSRDVADRARSAFREFTASRYSGATREESTYLAPGDNLQEAIQVTTTRAVDQMREAPPSA